jgi:hypothetical protein
VVFPTAPRTANNADLCYNFTTSGELPPLVRQLLWYDFSHIGAEKHRKTIIVQALNYGTLEHWRWIKKHYGSTTIREALSSIPASEIRPRAQRLASWQVAGTADSSTRCLNLPLDHALPLKKCTSEIS